MVRGHQEKTFSAFVIGITVGIALTALLTPCRGDEVRSAIKHKTKTLKDSIEDKKDTVKDKVAHSIHDTTEKIDEKTDRMAKQKLPPKGM